MHTPDIAVSNRRGSLVLSVAFVVFAASIGFALMTHTVHFLRIQGARSRLARDRGRLGFALTERFHRFRERILAEDFSAWPDPEVSFFNETLFPPERNDTVETTIRFHFHTERLAEFSRHRFRAAVGAHTTTAPHEVRSEAVFDLYNGCIPLSRFPLILRRQNETDPGDYLRERNIRYEGQIPPVVIEESGGFDVSAFLANALKLRGGNLTWRSLREKLNMPVSDEPIEAGVYPIRTAEELTAVFVQGDLDRLVLGIQDGWQEVCLVFRGTPFQLRYRPGGGELLCWDASIPRDCPFAEHIIVNGDLWSLEKGEAPDAFLEEANLTLSVSGDVHISDTLTQENLSLRPFGRTRFILICGRHALSAAGTEDNRVRVAVDGDARIEGTLLIDGRLENLAESLVIRGGLSAKDIENAGDMTIHSASPETPIDDYFLSPAMQRVMTFAVESIEESFTDGS